MTILDHIPPGAFLTVTLKNGVKFTGEEETRDDERAAGYLRMFARRSDNEHDVFYTTADQVACFQMTCEG
jgi:hypothetical protein